MKPTTIALILAMTAAPAYAGGPVVIEDKTETVAPAQKQKIPSWVVLALGIAVIAAISGNSDNCFAEEPVEPPPSGGC